MKHFRWWLVLAAMFGAVVIAALPQSDSVRTPDERVAHLSKQIRCPTCAGRSVEESMAPLAVSSKEEITKRVQEGQSDEQIRAYFVSRYGNTALMSPERTGINRLPWVLPVLFVAAGAFVLVLAMRRWQAAGAGSYSPSDDDRSLVEAALRGRS
jgi:cytochrome c-type biogenesis protein CcmH/NrfF